ncbi:hypothetical protein ACLMAJ_04730 [Nocardia sp. KC 131]|uniref:hypothetical protein n=1 Tax=Nocardia arseniciresistens TaxID=3392119 RepID=UPI00398ECBED
MVQEIGTEHDDDSEQVVPVVWPDPNPLDAWWRRVMAVPSDSTGDLSHSGEPSGRGK